MSKVIFICTGNTCRSPMAAALYCNLCPEAEVTSAGLFADGSEYCKNSILALQEMGISLKGNSRMLEKSDLDADRFFVMSPSHEAALLSIGIKQEKITVLNVSDPFGGDIEVYKKCRNEIARKLMRETVSIRPMTEEDIPQVALLESACFSEPWSEKGLLDSLREGARFWVAVIGSKVLGYMGATTVLDEAYVTNVAVFPQYRGYGIGRALIDTASDFCRNGDFAFLTLEVRESNKRAISLYSSADFRESGKRKNFYSNPSEDAVLMTKEFKK